MAELFTPQPHRDYVADAAAACSALGIKPRAFARRAAAGARTTAARARTAMERCEAQFTCIKCGFPFNQIDELIQHHKVDHGGAATVGAVGDGACGRAKSR